MKIRDLLGLLTALIGALTLSQGATAQPAGGAPRAAPEPTTGEQAALVDLTGYWVSVVTEDWRWRMLTAPHGDYASVPLNPLGKQVADMWTPAQDGSCKAYGAAGIMRMPTRVHITWADPNTLKLETDWGEQTRLFHFVPGRPFTVSYMGPDRGPQQGIPGAGPGGPGGPGGPAGPGGGGAAAGPGAAGAEALGGAQQPATLQGRSIAAWQRPYVIDADEGVRGPPRGAAAAFGGRMRPQPGGDLEVFTIRMSPGWLRRNGVPYGARTQLTEYYQTFTDPIGRKWFDVTTQVVDPEYLMNPFITSSDFRSEPDGSKWAPHPCKDTG